jgi:hypothetical protein
MARILDSIPSVGGMVPINDFACGYKPLVVESRALYIVAEASIVLTIPPRGLYRSGSILFPLAMQGTTGPPW